MENSEKEGWTKELKNNLISKLHLHYANIIEILDTRISQAVKKWIVHFGRFEF